jgi:hypothetical protein
LETFHILVPRDVVSGKKENALTEESKTCDLYDWMKPIEDRPKTFLTIQELMKMLNDYYKED